MSLSDLAALGSLVSGLAVLGSLIYLSVQVRQATKHQRSLMMQGRATRTMELAFRRSEPSFASAWEKVATGQIKALSHTELWQLSSIAQANIISIEETWLDLQRKRGSRHEPVLGDGFAGGIKSMAGRKHR